MLDSYPQKNENINWRSQLLTKLKTISIITRPDIRNHYAGRGQVCLHSHLVPSWGLDARNSAAWADPIPLLGIALCFGATHNMFGTPGTPTICWQTCLQLLWNHSWKHIRGVRNNHHCGKDRFQYKKTTWRYGIYPINTNSKRVCNIRLGGVPKTMSLQRKNTWQFRRCRFQENDGSQPEINMFFLLHTNPYCGRNPAPVARWFVPCLYSCHPVQDFVHAQYH